MTNEELQVILEKHQLWLEGSEGGVRANLSGANLFHTVLSGANLSGADLSHAYLFGADLSDADLSRAYLFRAYLYGADLSGANLSGANLSGAYLFDANLSHADLLCADLFHAYLTGTNLSHADLSGTNLSYANLSGANLANVRGQSFITVGNIGSRNAQTIYHIETGTIYCGCWKSSLDDFEKRVDDKYGDRLHGQEYKAAIIFIRTILQIKGGSKNETI